MYFIDFDSYFLGETCHKELGQLLECISQHDDNAKCSQQFIALAACYEKQEVSSLCKTFTLPHFEAG